MNEAEPCAGAKPPRVALTVSVTVRQREVENRSVEVRLFVRPPLPSEGETPQKIPVGSQAVALNAASASVEFAYTPSEPGRFVFEADRLRLSVPLCGVITEVVKGVKFERGWPTPGVSES